MADTKQRVTELVDELHRVLESADDLDDHSREALRSAASDIRISLAAEGGEADESPLDALRERLERFEGEHPTLTEAVRRLVDQLADMGI
jgi:predicted nuclease with TOPRIM domain